jgi:hypothetical protein
MKTQTVKVTKGVETMARVNRALNLGVSEDNDDLPKHEVEKIMSETQSVKDSDDIDDIPDELGDEQGTTTTAANTGGSASNTAGMSIEEFNALGFNDERDEHERLKLWDAPTGDWEKTDRWKVEKRVYEGDCLPGDIDPMGRTVLNVTGKPKGRVANGIEYTPQLFLRISPDIRYKQDKPDEVDNSYKLFLQSKDTYLAINKEKVRTLGQLVAMLEEDNYIVRTMNGDTGPVSVGVKPRMEQRRR